ncbi:unknown protein [Seminavis robusta]|uniref:Uncharacterized protein n=1 Tax=Seminavis robusta TaxID=568900 RepID=A0A9N8F224_9STRA|nr:unknown protein [Seminavis robusta]|eukprot:Sro3320_g346700.1 n/a (307) ;mRNA; r:3230-4150
MRCLLSWAGTPSEGTTYVPKRKRGLKPVIRRIKGVPVAVASTLMQVANRTAQAARIILALNQMAIEHSVGVPASYADRDNPQSDVDEDDSSSFRANRTPKRQFQMTLWDLTHPRDASTPTTFQLFMRLIHALKAGIGIVAEEGNPMIALSLVIWSLNGTTNGNANDHQYDSDSVLIAIDNCSSRCITNCMRDFIGKPTPVKVSVQGIGGSVTAMFKGTVRWFIEDEQGKVHHFLIPNTYYNAATPFRLLSPQHWAQVSDDNYPRQRGTWCVTYEDTVELFWKQGSFKRVIKLSLSSNIALLRSAPA